MDEFEDDGRFQVHPRVLGRGAYGVVNRAFDTLLQRDVAIKKIEGVFDDILTAKSTLRELKLLRLCAHENVVRILHVLPPSFPFNDVFIVQELMESNLAKVIRDSRDELTMDHVRYIVFQVLIALKHIHSLNVLHRDLKPSNLLVNRATEIKICDFGMSRTLNRGMSGYVVTRHYRAPELLTCRDDDRNCYTTAIDVWSLGCIFAELINGRVLFPGESTTHQIRLICDAIGRPGEEELGFIRSQQARRYILTEIEPTARTPVFADLFSPDLRMHPDALDLLEQMLQFNPDRRVTVEQALEHPFIHSAYPSTAAAPTPALAASEFEYENNTLSLGRLRELILEEIRIYNPNLGI